MNTCWFVNSWKEITTLNSQYEVVVSIFCTHKLKSVVISLLMSAIIFRSFVFWYEQEIKLNGSKLKNAIFRISIPAVLTAILLGSTHARRPRGSPLGRKKRWDESFQVRAKEPLGTDSHRTISKNSSGCRLLIGYKKCFVLLCPIGEQFLLSSFREFVHDGYCLATLARFVHQSCACNGNFYFLLS